MRSRPGCGGRSRSSTLPVPKPRTDDAYFAHHDSAAKLRSGRTQAFATWADVTGVAMAA